MFEGNSSFDDEEEGLEVQTFDFEDGSTTPVRARWRLKSSISKVLILGVAVVLVFCGAFLGGVMVGKGQANKGDDSHSHDDFPKAPGFTYANSKTETFRHGPLSIQSGQVLMSKDRDIPRPKGDVAIHEVHIRFEDKFGRRLPLTRLYNHHVLFYDDRSDCNFPIGFLAGFGAEGEKTPLALPDPYVVQSGASSPWAVSYHLIDLWGVPATTNTTFYLVYDVTYSTFERKEHKPVLLSLVGYFDENEHGVGAFELDIPGDGATVDSTMSVEADFVYDGPDATLVATAGHIHIGSLNSTLKEKDGRDISTSKAFYDENGFIVAITRDYVSLKEDYTLKHDQTYTLQCVYSNTHHYKGVMCLQIVYLYSPDIDFENTATHCSSSSSSDADDDSNGDDYYSDANADADGTTDDATSAGQRNMLAARFLKL